jgi:hypothetical protein
MFLNWRIGAFIGFFLFFPSRVEMVAGQEEAKDPARSPPPDSDPFTETEFGENPAYLSSSKRGVTMPQTRSA